MNKQEILALICGISLAIIGLRRRTLWKPLIFVPYEEAKRTLLSKIDAIDKILIAIGAFSFLLLIYSLFTSGVMGNK